MLLVDCDKSKLNTLAAAGSLHLIEGEKKRWMHQLGSYIQHELLGIALTHEFGACVIAGDADLWPACALTAPT